MSHDNAAERCQRLLSLGLRQLAPQRVEIYGPAENWARGGAIIAISPAMGHLLGPRLVELASIQPAEAGWRARLLGHSPISVKMTKWG